jgi:hypothetical protein
MRLAFPELRKIQPDRIQNVEAVIELRDPLQDLVSLLGERLHA